MICSSDLVGRQVHIFKEGTYFQGLLEAQLDKCVKLVDVSVTHDGDEFCYEFKNVYIPNDNIEWVATGVEDGFVDDDHEDEEV